AHFRGHLSGDGFYTKQCHHWLENHLKTNKALLTHSCTAALEMAAILIDLQPGDEVIMPSYTFVSTANAFVLRGAIPVFIDIRSDTLNIDENKIAAAITEKTKAIVVVHYAGVACEMETILAIAKKYQLWVIEDAAQAILSTYFQRPLGSIGHLGCLSFHETKNIISGEGGALLINNPELIQRAEIIREKGTNRSQFFRGQVDKYTWCDLGSSYLPSELIAAFLAAQLEAAYEIHQRRLAIWQDYHQAFAELEQQQLIRRPIIPANCEHNAHMYYLLLADLATRSQFITHLKQQQILAVFHYVPLHTAPAGIRYGRADGELANTLNYSERLVRLPLWLGLESQLPQVINSVIQTLTTMI
ncbi:MAG: dTDP-4-amino-4,6-dideoxygalactose transaminase, partial [Pseudomonadota bacterium]